MKILNLSNKVIEFSFYALFFLVPLIFWKDTSELYELNKMWLVFIATIVVIAAWLVKTAVLKRIFIQRTPLDIPILLFLVSQIISTIVSLDPYVSFWGYYSRFNGGLLSTICYILLYYAFLSNFEIKTKAVDVVKRILGISLVSSAIVALWGLPSHFGYDPTCLIFRGSFDVSCWTADFQPKIRIFSTLGQPDWLGAYLAILTPLVIAYFLNSKRRLYTFGFLLLTVIFYIDTLFTKSRSALLGLWGSVVLFAIYYFFKELQLKIREINLKKVWPKIKPISLLLIVLLVLTAIILNPIELRSTKGKLQLKTQTVQSSTGTFSSGGGGTESGKIRLLVWQGALTAWLHNPILGTGVETFAFAYYKYKPAAHNLTSEWNYLYNKAHNEYLNYLATAGILGLGSYLFVIGSFLYLMKKLTERKVNLFVPALVASYISILITNFFGFSVVIVNLYFFLIPAFVFIISGILNPKKVLSFSFSKNPKEEALDTISLTQKFDILAIILVSGSLIIFLVNFWLADQAYALGSNLSGAGDYITSYSLLKSAAQKVSFEPTYKDELASDDAILAVSLLSNLPKDDKGKNSSITFAQELAKEAITSVEENTLRHPNNVVFQKTKVRVYYALSQIDPKYLKNAISAIKTAQKLAPTDANIYYNLGLLYGQNGQIKEAIDTLSQAIKIKSNYTSAYYALGLFYRELATNSKGQIIDQNLAQKAVDEMQYILKNLDPKNQDAKDALKQWTRQ